jgi:hypothetical protein
MWLLDTVTLKLCHFESEPPPAYAILSHTWAEEEVTFEEIGTPEGKQKRGYQKIEGCCALARADGLSYAWIDTCCIDNTSSAQLSEAINSMFRWYSKAHVCYAYLADVTLSNSLSPLSLVYSRWFKRGWTLQELIAPMAVVFYDGSWSYIGTKASLLNQIADITAISYEVLINPSSIRRESVAERMSWAASRKTTRVEDMAYCLMGIFDVNMPLLYGEGLKAFRRLQMQIIADSADLSILTWCLPHPSRHTLGRIAPLVPCGVLAASPEDFSKNREDPAIVSNAIVKATPSSILSLTNLGLSIWLPLLRLDGSTVAVLNCQQNGKWVGIHVYQEPETTCYYRDRISELVHVDANIQLEQPRQIYLSTKDRLTDAEYDISIINISVTNTTNSAHSFDITRILVFDDDRDLVASDDRKVSRARRFIFHRIWRVLVLLQNRGGDSFSLLFGRDRGKIWTHGVPRDLTEPGCQNSLSLWQKVQQDLHDPKSAWRYFNDRRCYSRDNSYHLQVTTKKSLGDHLLPNYEVKVEQISSTQSCIPRSNCSLHQVEEEKSEGAN